MKLFSSKLFLSALALLIVCVLLVGFNLSTGRFSPLTNAAGAALTPVQRALTSAGNFVSDLFGYFYRYDSLVEENARLKARVQELEQAEREYYAAIDENASLRELAGLKRRNAEFEYELAEVIGVSSDGVSTVYTLSRGEKDGVEVNDAVVTGDGLAGYVSAVGSNFCEVRPVTDLSMSVGATISRTRETVVAEGSYELCEEGMLRLSYLKNDSDVLAGDAVETSGYGGVFPKGLLIGWVAEVLPESHGLSAYAKVRPAADLSQLKKVYIVKSFVVTE